MVVYSDFPKKSEDRDAVNGVRSLLDQTCGFGSLSIVKRSKNFGLANSIIDGVTMILNEFDSAIILEDDVVPCSFFLDYMTDSMQKYRNHQAVGSVHAYSFPVLEILPETFSFEGPIAGDGAHGKDLGNSSMPVVWTCFSNWKSKTFVTRST